MNPNRGTPWTQDEYNQLAQMYDEKLTYLDIGQRLGRGPNMVKSAVHRLIANGVIKEMRSASKPKPMSKGCLDESAIDGSRRLRDAMFAYYHRHVWKDAA